MRDVRYALRLMRATPLLTSVLVLTMTLGIGASTALFSVVYGVLYRPLSFHEPDRLMQVRAAHIRRGVVPYVSYEDFKDFEREERSFQHLAMSVYWTFNLTGRAVPQRLTGVRLTGESFPMLGVPALLGRTIVPSDDRPGGGNVVVLGHALWRAEFGGDPGIVGRVLALNGVPTTVVGVMPAAFTYPAADVQLWAPMADEMRGVPRNSRFMFGFGRLKHGVSAAQAEADLNAAAARLAARFPDANKGWSVRITPALEAQTQEVRGALLTLFGAVAGVLLIACANTANLLSARAAARQRESAVRIALGAGARRLAGQHLSEALVIAVCAGVLGIAVAYGAVEAVRRLAPSDIPRISEIAIDPPVLLFTVGAIVVSALLFGLAPARQALRGDVAPALRDSGRTVTGDRSGRRLRATLVVVEIAMAIPLVAAGGLLVRSFGRVLDVDPGFRPDGLVAMNVFLVGPKYMKIPDQKAYVSAALEGIARLPAVQHAAAMSQVPFSETTTNMRFRMEGDPPTPGEAPVADYRAASASYFATVGMKVLAGRGITESDTAESQPVAVINEAMARRYFPGRAPADVIGRRIMWYQSPDPQWVTLVGIVNDVRSLGLERDESPATYVPFTQRTLPFLRWMTFVARVSGNPVSTFPPMRTALFDVDPEQPVTAMTTLDAAMRTLLAERRFNMLLMTIFAGVGVLLATVGLFGMLSFAVAQRTREIGVRMALGARRADIIRMVLADSARLSAAGLAIGGVAAVAAARTIRSMLFGVTPVDPATFAAITVVVAAVAVIASYGPARRAASVDPVIVMRD